MNKYAFKRSIARFLPKDNRRQTQKHQNAKLILNTSDPYEILGFSKDATPEEVRKNIMSRPRNSTYYTTC